ncbi:MAG: amidase [Rubrivivax sp.]|nr:amidase [Pyrinomonadaceae bacterium]
MIRARSVSPVEVVEAHLRRIEEMNPSLNAIVTLAPDALECAREAEESVMRGGRGKDLLGVPVTVKDTIDARGMHATAGTRVREGYVPGLDAPAVGFLKQAGAIIIGKTNTSELALDYTTDNPVFGRTNNPHDLARTPGGSSGGCAAAVSARMTPLSLGSDLVGSIRIPAHFCGVAGLKPTVGRVLGVGHFPGMSGAFERGASLGPLARTIADLWLMFRVLTGDAFELEESDLELSLDRATDKLVDVRAAWYADDNAMPVTTETRESVERAASSLQAAGLIVEASRPPGVERATKLWLSLFSGATDEFVRSVYAGREGEAGPVARSFLERAVDASGGAREAESKAWAERDRLRAELLRWMETRPILVAPVGAVPAFRHEEARRVEVGGQAVSTFRAFSYAQAFNVFDLPAACVPVGRSREGLPIGVQIVGRPREEEKVLAAARIVEAALGGWQPPPDALPNASANPL